VQVLLKDDVFLIGESGRHVKLLGISTNLTGYNTEEGILVYFKYQDTGKEEVKLIGNYGTEIKGL